MFLLHPNMAPLFSYTQSLSKSSVLTQEACLKPALFNRRRENEICWEKSLTDCSKSQLMILRRKKNFAAKNEKIDTVLVMEA